MVHISFHMIEMWTIRIRLSFRLTQWPLWILKWWWQQLEGTSRASSGFLCTRSVQGLVSWVVLCTIVSLPAWAPAALGRTDEDVISRAWQTTSSYRKGTPPGSQAQWRPGHSPGRKILTGSSRLVCWCQVGICASSPVWGLGCLPGPGHS